MILALIGALFAFFVAQLLLSKSKSVPIRPKATGNLIIIDTETNGFPVSWKSAETDVNSWPRMVSISWYKIAPAGNVLSAHTFVIKPEGFVIKESSTHVHGITQDWALERGVQLNIALAALQNDLQDSNYLVAHNMEFDYPVLVCEYLRSNLSTEQLQPLKKICTMKLSTQYCKLPGSGGRYKYPSLEELYTKLFTSQLQGKHTSENDAKACMLCFKELYNLNIIKL